MPQCFLLIILMTFGNFFAFPKIFLIDKNNNFENQITDTIIRDIPLNKYGKTSNFYKNKSKLENQLALPTLEEGYDSLQIRFWFDYSFIDSCQLVIIKKDKNAWSAELVSFLKKYKSDDDITIGQKRIVSIFPKTGWQDFTSKLFQLQILTLPDERKISTYSMFTDANGIVVEISTKSEYRIYQYQGPMIVDHNIWQIKNMKSILYLLENELGFKPLRKY